MSDISVSDFVAAKVYRINRVNETSITFIITNYLFRTEDLDFGEAVFFPLESETVAAVLEISCPIHANRMTLGLGTIDIWIPELNRHAKLSCQIVLEELVDSLTMQISDAIKRRLGSFLGGVIPLSIEEESLNGLMIDLSSEEIEKALSVSANLFLQKNRSKLDDKATSVAFVALALSIFQKANE